MMILLGCNLLSLALVAALGETKYSNQMRRTEYDYIIIGAGSSGAVVANRLSEDPDKTVLLLEAGGIPPKASDIPALLGPLQGVESDWGYRTVPQEKACLAYINQTCYWPRGKALGGTSHMNGMLYIRGNHEDYNNWLKHGATGWGWKDVFPYFLKSEDQADPELAKSGYHNVDGLLGVTTSTYATPLREANLQAARQLGYDILDFNGANQTGFNIAQLTVRDGLRCSTERAFLRPFTNRTNLDILTNAHVRKILINRNNRAYAVSFDRSNATHEVRALKEIVLSAGAIGSPQILMLSGVGPRKHLEELGIEVVADLPVGENLQDHIAMGGHVYSVNDTVSLVSSRDFNDNAYEQLKKGTGPLTVAGMMQNAGFVNTRYRNGSENWPDVQIIFYAGVPIPAKSLNPELEALLKNTTATKDLIQMIPFLLRPKSRGTIRLRSSDPYEYPLLNPCYFCDEEDLEVLVEGAQIIRNFMNTPALKIYNPSLFLKPEQIEGCAGLDAESVDYLRCLGRAMTFAAHHQVGTCKMGDPQEPSTVVDPELRVKGIAGLRVADASIMPFVPSGNTNAPCIMIGEKVSDMIRGRQESPA